MRTKHLFILIGLVLLSGCFDDWENSSPNEEVNCLKVDLGLNDNEIIERVASKKKQPDLILLKRVHLPKNASLCQKRDFVDQILYLSSNQRSYLETDPQVQMIALAIKGNEEDFLTLAKPNWHSPNSYISDAYIRSLSDTKNKSFARKHFAQNPWLIEVITSNNWSNEFKVGIIKYVESKNGNVNYSFATAFVQLDDPDTKDLILESLFNSGGNRHIFYKIINNLEWLNLNEQLKKIWNSDNVSDLELQYLAYALGNIGYIPVLDYLVSKINGTTYDNPYRKNLDYFNHLTNQQLDKDSAKEWLKENRDKLEFDSDLKIYKTRNLTSQSTRTQ